jgi:hypothetical protein
MKSKLFKGLIVVQFENSMNRNEHERISRKDAKAQRKTASLLCAFASLRETFLSVYETEPLLKAWLSSFFNPRRA